MSKVFAATAFVYQDGKVLAVKRADDGKYCLPGGKVEPEEQHLHTAIRECFEETGYVVCSYAPSVYAGLDDTGRVVKTYRSDIVAKGEPLCPEEGEAVWVEPRTLVENSMWGEYNWAFLAHFGINWEDKE